MGRGRRRELDNGQWVIDGSKKWITNSGTDITGGVTVIARTGTREKGKPELTAIIVPQDTPGYTRGPGYEKLGWRASDQHPLYFDDCRVPEENLLGERGKGFRQFLATLDGGRVAVAALSVGLAQACFDEALARAKEREQFGRSIAGFQAIQFKLADMAMEIELARNMVLKAAWLRDMDRSFGREASMAKVFASEAAKRAADQAAQIWGGEGFMETSAVARYWRQVKINEIGEGTSEINRQIIARSLLAETAQRGEGAYGRAIVAIVPCRPHHGARQFAPGDRFSNPLLLMTRAVVEVDRAASEAAFVHQVEVQADVVGERPLAAPYHDGHEEQVPLVDQPGLDRVGGEVRAAHLRSRSDEALIRRTTSGSKSRSISVLAVIAFSNVLEYTTLSADCQIWAKSRIRGDWSARVGSVSQPTIISYIRRP